MEWACIWVESCTKTDNLFKIDEFKNILHFPKSYNGNLTSVKHLTNSTSVSRREWTRFARIQKNIKMNQFMFNWNIHISSKLPDFWGRKNNSYNTYLQTYFSPSSLVMTKEDWPKGCQTANFTCNNRSPWPQWQLPVRSILKLIRNWGEQISLCQGKEIGKKDIIPFL